MSKVFKNAWAHINEPSPVLTKADKALIGKEIFKESLKAQGSPWAICTASVGRENSAKYEDCVMHVKDQLGVSKDMKEEDFGKNSVTEEELMDEAARQERKILDNKEKSHPDPLHDHENELAEDDEDKDKEKDVGLGYAGPTPNSGLAAQDLEVDTQETTKLENETSEGTKEKEDPSGPLPNRVQLG